MQNDPEREMSLIGHLTELRYRIIISLIALVICFLAAFSISRPVLIFLTEPVEHLKAEPDKPDSLTLSIRPDGSLQVADWDGPLDPESIATSHFYLLLPGDGATSPAMAERRLRIGSPPTQKLYYGSPLDPMMMRLKVALIVGILLALPVLLWQTWSFIAPGLTRNERRVAKPMLVGALFLFPIGAAFAYGIVRLLLLVMQNYSTDDILPLLDVFKYLSLMTKMMLIFGIIFELPLVVAIAARIGLVTPAMLVTHRRHAYVVLALAAMILTPADPYSMLIALIPLVGLYEISIAVARPMAMLRTRDEEDIPMD